VRPHLALVGPVPPPRAHRPSHVGRLPRAEGAVERGVARAELAATVAPAPLLHAAHGDGHLRMGRHQHGGVEDAVLLGAGQLLAVQQQERRSAPFATLRNGTLPASLTSVTRARVASPLTLPSPLWGEGGIRSSSVSQAGSSRLGARSGTTARAPWVAGSPVRMVARSLATSGTSFSVRTPPADFRRSSLTICSPGGYCCIRYVPIIPLLTYLIRTWSNSVRSN
jgi:hypothetical protein